MRMSFTKVHRIALFILLVILTWSVWNLAAQDKAPTAATNTSAVVTLPPAHETPEWIGSLSQQLPFLKQTLWGNELWKYLFSLIYIFLAFYVSKFLDYLTRVWLKRWTAKTETKLDDMILEVLNGPIKVVAFIVLLRIGLDVFEWPEIVEKVLAKGLTIIVAVSLTYMVMKFVDLLINFWRQRKDAEEDDAFNKQLFPIIRKSLKAFVIVVAALVTLDNLGVNITAAIASLSIGGLAVGLAAQDTLANLFGGIAIFLDKPFRIGDRIVLDKIDGPVESIGMRSTRVRSLDGFLVTIPNKTMGNAIIINISARPTIQTVMNIGITYDTPTEQVKQALKIIEDVYKGHPGSSNCLISFNKFEDSALNILVIHWWHSTNYAEYLNGMQEMNLALKERFDTEGIGFAFPTQTLYVKQDSDWRWSQPK